MARGRTHRLCFAEVALASHISTEQKNLAQEIARDFLFNSVIDLINCSCANALFSAAETIFFILSFIFSFSFF